MSDIPQQLNDVLRNLPESYKSAKYSAAAYELILYYTSVSVHYLSFKSFPLGPDEFHEDRLKWLGASLFMLRNEPIMPELCRRLKERDIRSTYFEISAACFCKEIGFSVLQSPGKPQKGLDFDFTIAINPLF